MTDILNDIDEDVLSLTMEEYHDYINNILETILDFDIWFEKSKNQEWYERIKTGNVKSIGDKYPI